MQISWAHRDKQTNEKAMLEHDGLLGPQAHKLLRKVKVCLSPPHKAPLMGPHKMHISLLPLLETGSERTGKSRHPVSVKSYKLLARTMMLIGFT